MKSNHVTDLTHGSVVHHLITFAIPLMLGNIFQLSYNMVDTIVIGRFAGSVSLAAVGTCDQIMNLLILGVSGVALACVLGWSAMLTWTLPWRLQLKNKNE